MSDVIRLKIALCDADPPIWRRIEVGAATSLKALHPIIQAAMGWENYHLFEFEIGRTRVSAGRATLAELMADGAKRFLYTYDMGDNWEHGIVIEKTLAADPAAAYPRLIEGAGRCPPEDVGGVPGFYEFLDALGDPKHPDHEDRLDWHGGPFDAADMGEGEIRKRLAKIAGRRKRT